MLETQAWQPRLVELRSRLDTAFSPLTATPGSAIGLGSTGHCAAVALIVQQILGGELVSTCLEGESHWINRVSVHGNEFDIDLTGDQFGRPAVQVNKAGELYEDIRVRSPDDLLPETLSRAAALAAKAGLDEVATALELRLRTRRVSESQTQL